MSSDADQAEQGAAPEPVTTQTTENVINTLLLGVQQQGDKSGPKAKRITKRARRRRRIEVMTSQELATEGRRHDLILRKRIGIFALVGVSAELFIANAVFVLYAWLGERWKVPTEAINVWLGATLVQVIGILYVITNYLFPKSGTPLIRDE